MADVSNLVTPVAPVSNIYPTIPAGSNRMAFLTVHTIRGGATNTTAPSGVTVAGVAGTFVGGDAPSNVQIKSNISTWCWTESQIASISGGTIVISGAAADVITSVAWAVKDAAQTTPTRTAKQYISTGAISISQARAAGSWTFLGVAASVAENLTLTNPARTSRISNINIGYAADIAQTVSSTSQSKTYVQTAHVINIEPVPAQVLSSITPDPLVVGSAFTVSTTGFSNGAANFSVGGVTVAITLSSGSATSSLPAFYDVMPLPFLPAILQTATVTQSALTATRPVGVGLPTGFDVTRDGSDIPANFSGIVTDDPKYIGYHFLAAGNPLTTGDRCYWPMMTISGNSIEIDQDGRVRVPEELYDESDTVVVPIWVHRADGNIYAHEMTVPIEGGIVIAVETVNGVAVGSIPVVRVGQVGNTVTSSGFVEFVSISTLTNAATNISAPGGDGTFDWPTWANNIVREPLGNKTFTFYDGVNSEDVTLNEELPSDHATVTMSGAGSANPLHLGHYVPLPNGRRVYYPTANGLVINPDGSLSASSLTNVIVWVHNLESGGDLKTNSLSLIVDATGIVVRVDTINGIAVASTPVLRVGATGNTITTTNLGTLTSVSTAYITATNVVAPGGDGTFDWPDWAEGEVRDSIGVKTLIATDTDGDMASASVNALPPVGWTSVVASSADDSDPHELGYLVPLPDGRTVYYPTANGLVINPDGSLSASTDITVDIWVHNLELDGDMKTHRYTIQVGPGGLLVDTTMVLREVHFEPVFFEPLVFEVVRAEVP
jgi:hypothetical protein